MPGGQKALRYVYFLLTKHGHIKIGSSEQVPKRWRSLRELISVPQGHKGRYLLVVPGTYQFEFYVQKLFAAHRVPPSWFRRHFIRVGREIFFDRVGIRNWVKAAENPEFLKREYEAAGVDPNLMRPSSLITHASYLAIMAALEWTGSNRSEAARILGLRRQSFQRMIKNVPHDIVPYVNRQLLTRAQAGTLLSLVRVLAGQDPLPEDSVDNTS